MNIFHIPSWYPNREEPLEGFFIRDYIYAAAGAHKEDNHIISNQREYAFPCSFKDPGKSFREIISYLKAPGRPSEKKEENVFSLFTSRTLEYTASLGFDLLKEYGAKHLRNFETALKQFGHIDLVHAHVTFPAGIFALAISRKYNIPYIITEHSGPFPFKFILENATYLNKLKEALDNAAAIVAVSNKHAKDIQQYTDNPVKVIFNQVNPTPVNNDAEVKNQALVLLAAAIKLNEQKGIPQLLKAVAALKDTLTDKKAELWLVGDGGSEIPELVATLGLEQLVKIKGKLPKEELAKVMHRCDIFVLPSRVESFGLVYVEAIMAGKPVIATKCGGPEDIVDPDNGLLVSVDDHQALVNAIDFMVKNMANFDAGKIREHAIEKFSPQHIIRQYHKLYQEVSSNNQ